MSKSGYVQLRQSFSILVTLALPKRGAGADWVQLFANKTANQLTLLQKKWYIQSKSRLTNRKYMASYTRNCKWPLHCPPRHIIPHATERPARAKSLIIIIIIILPLRLIIMQRPFPFIQVLSPLSLASLYHPKYTILAHAPCLQVPDVAGLDPTPPPPPPPLPPPVQFPRSSHAMPHRKMISSYDERGTRSQ